MWLPHLTVFLNPFFLLTSLTAIKFIIFYSTIFFIICWKRHANDLVYHMLSSANTAFRYNIHALFTVSSHLKLVKTVWLIKITRRGKFHSLIKLLRVVLSVEAKKLCLSVWLIKNSRRIFQERKKMSSSSNCRETHGRTNYYIYWSEFFIGCTIVN